MCLSKIMQNIFALIVYYYINSSRIHWAVQNFYKIGSCGRINAKFKHQFTHIYYFLWLMLKSDVLKFDINTGCCWRKS